MQRLHEQDLAGWLLDGGNGEEWEHLCLPAIQPDGSALWPEKHSIERLRVMEDAAPYVFSGQYRQLPSPPAGGFFKPDRIEIVDALPAEFIKEVRAWDLAASENEGDWTAGPRMLKTKENMIYIVDMVRGRWGPDVHCRIGSLEEKVFLYSGLMVVHCRIGSLEVRLQRLRHSFDVHCRIGSLEEAIEAQEAYFIVHCRIGSLEVTGGVTLQHVVVHCRIGSLEESSRTTPIFCHVHCRIGSLEVIYYQNI